MIPSSACRQSPHADQPGQAGHAWRPCLSYTTPRDTILAEGVGSWLRFEQLCGRSELFSERYLAAPIGQILLGNGLRVTPEYVHPVLSAHTSGRGKRPAIDFVARTNGEAEIKVAIETKWIGNTVPKFDDVLWDLIRLALIVKSGPSHAYFLLGGTSVSLAKFLASEPFTTSATNGSKKFLLRIGDNQATTNRLRQNINSVPLGPVVPAWRLRIARLLSSYQSLEVPNTITTQLISRFPDAAKADQYQVIAWKVGTKANGGIFRAGNTLHYSTNQSF